MFSKEYKNVTMQHSISCTSVTAANQTYPIVLATLHINIDGSNKTRNSINSDGRTVTESRKMAA